ncbi:MAG TPA: C-GCAxxG-C-C family protein [Acidimicrobiia bacterium]|nr:C-GCAxxG-C-C family protein [Acidimicrobiia bacterium]
MPDALRRTRELFLDDANTYGCAEVALIVLQEQLGRPGAGDSSSAMALNGGIAYSGATCGAITGAALAAGRLAGCCLPDHAEAKREARSLVQGLLAAFANEFGSVDCRGLTGHDFRDPDAHEAFIQSGVWRTVCLRQIEFAISEMTRLIALTGWAPPAPDGRSPDAPPTPPTRPG